MSQANKARLTVVGYSMGAAAAGVLLAWLCVGCSMVLTEASTPEVRYLITPLAPAETYARAQRTAATMGAVILRDDPQSHTFVAQYKGGLALHVHVHTIPAGTQLTVAASVLPQKVGYGLITEADDFITAYRQER